MRDYLGVEPPNDALGVLQDMHWAVGAIGYFSTYALGNVISGQLWEKVTAEIPEDHKRARRAERHEEAAAGPKLEEARVVRQVFAWVGQERLTIGEVVRRLTAAGETTRTGRTTWDRTVVWAMLKNPASIGQAAFGKRLAGAAGGNQFDAHGCEGAGKFDNPLLVGNADEGSFNLAHCR